MSKEAMKLALEALEDKQSDDPYPYSLESKAIAALRETLAEKPIIKSYLEKDNSEQRCKYGYELTSCTRSPMDCQCALDVVFEQSAQQEPWCMKMNGCKTKCEDCPVEVQPAQQEPVTDEENEKFSRDVSGFKGADPEATKYALDEFLRNRVPAIGDIRALKHRIHALEGDVIGYKQLLDAAEQPAQRKPLTRQHINQMMADAGWQNSAIRQADLDKVEKVARAIEAAHGIKGDA